MYRQTRHLAAQSRDSAIIDCTQPAQQRERLRNGSFLRRLQPRKTQHVFLTQMQKLQDRCGEIDAANLRLRLFRPRAMRSGAPEPHANTRLRPSGSSSALIGGGARDRRQLQTIQSHARIENQQSRQPGIDNAGDALNCD
jgi:hypothetical protein